jgi:hypothetical protein
MKLRRCESEVSAAIARSHPINKEEPQDMKWHIGKTLDLVEAKFGRPQREAANGPVQSTNQRLRYAQFHYREVVKELAAYRASSLSDRMVIDVAFSQDEDERGDYYAFMERIGAHAVACVQSIHAIADLLAASVFASLNLNAKGKAVDEHSVTFGLTLERVATDSQYLGVEAMLKALKANASFQRVEALSNKAKHSSIVRPVLNEDLTGERSERLEIRFESFERKGVSYPQAVIEDVLAPAYDLASRTTVDVGNELTKILTRGT